MQYFVRSRGGIFLYRIAYDESYPKYGRGQMLLEAAMERLLEGTDALRLDACTDPNNEFLLAMLPERLTTTTILMGTGGSLDWTLVSDALTITRGVARLRRTSQEVRGLRRKSATKE
ncbi:MAG TPA: GNAT family N-acetyltransferase [Acidimicrobiales bacterium]|jgi:hypothetical protein|nr:GNAT family N-acetyltransferase [Acidimicrobiales bacterium]